MEALLPWLSALGVVGSLTFGTVAMVRTRRQDRTQDVKTDAAMLSEIGYIRANTDEIKAEQKEQRKTNIDVLTRLAEVEQSARQAHKRLDELLRDTHNRG